LYGEPGLIFPDHTLSRIRAETQKEYISRRLFVDEKMRSASTPSLSPAMEKTPDVTAEEVSIDEKNVSRTQTIDSSEGVSRTRIQNLTHSIRDFFSVKGMQRSGAVLLKLARFTGPGTLISVAYVDPDNFQTSLDAGAQFKYRLLCIVLLGVLMAIYLQVQQPPADSLDLGLTKSRHSQQNWDV
jgi:hypothetical protein